MKKMIALLLVLGLFLSTTVYANPGVSPDKRTRVHESIMINEVEQRQRLAWEKLFENYGIEDYAGKIRYQYIPIENVQVHRLIPDHAIPVFFGADDTTIQIVYILNNTKFQLFYLPDGEMRKIAENLDDSRSSEENDFHINYNNSFQKSYNTKKLQSDTTITRSDAEVNRIREQMKKQTLALSNQNEAPMISQIEVQSNNAKLVYWNPDPNKFKADRRYNADWDFPALNNASRAVKIYLTRDYFVEKNKTIGQIISAGDAISLVGVAFNLNNIFKVKNLLSVAGVAYTINNILEEACKPVPFQEYEYSWGNEGTVYDTTVHNADVEVWSEWDNGRLNLVNLTSGEGLAWGVSAPSNVEPMDLSSQGLNNHAASLAENVAIIYNNNIYVYGIWKHGIGNGLGY